MSLDLSLYDDTALEALAPKGVVRRARRDFEAGLAAITERKTKTAVVESDGETVQIDTLGPKAAVCTCPATGICRHILLATMALNAGSGATPTDNDEAPAGPSAIEELSALAQSDLQAFAGADWAAALALAMSSANSVVQTSGRHCTVEIEGSPAAVTFLAGLGLKGAAFKGPKTRARAIVTAAALIVRARQGVALDPSTEDAEAPEENVGLDYLNDAAPKLLQCARMVLVGASPVAADTLFDLAISARAEAAPRLTSELRALTKQAGQAANRSVHFEPEAFLAGAARIYALIEAMKRHPNDPALTGVVRRNYEPAPAMDLWMLGAMRWTAETGARGLTLHGFSPTTGRWHAVVQARGPGQDPSFDASTAFAMPLWHSRSAKGLIGQVLHLTEPLVAGDGAIAPTLRTAVSESGAIASTHALMEVGATITSWANLRINIFERLGSGLRRRATPMPVLIAPARFTALSFDEFTQNYELEAVDQFGDALRLTLPAEANLDARRLSEMNRPPFLLAETERDLDRPSLRPIAVIHDGAKGVEVINLTLDQWSRTPRSTLETLESLLPRKRAASRLAQDPLAQLARRALAEATTACAGEAPLELQQLEQQCDAAGLTALAASLRRMSEHRSPLAALAAAYLASETLASLSWA